MPQSAVELLQHLIRIPSVNPDDQSGITGDGELALAQWLAQWLEGPSCEVFLDEVKPGRPN